MNHLTKEKYFSIISDYKQKLKSIGEELKFTSFETVFNSQLEDSLIDFDNLKGIVVMDNPGLEEKLQKEYLVGTAGKAFNKVLNSIGIQRSQVLVFNKSSITTPATNNLNELYKDEKVKEIFLREQDITFNTIKEVSLLLNLPIMLHGYSSYFKNGKRFIENEKSNRPLFVFFKNLYESKDLHDNIYFYKHSSYGNLSKQIYSFSEILDKDSICFEEYLNLGKSISQEFLKNKGINKI